MIDPYADVVATLAALVALLAAWPRILGLFKRPSIRVVAAQRCYVQHYCGRPQVHLFLDIQNKGGRSTTIISIRLDLKRRNGDRAWNLSAQTFSSDDLASRFGQLLGQHRELLIGSITLEPEEHWRGTVDAYDYPDESDEKRYNELYVQMEDEITKRKPLPSTAFSAAAPATGQADLVEVDPSMTKTVRDYFDGQFGLLAGPYELFVIVEFEDGKNRYVRGYSFTLYDLHEKDLRDMADNYKYGIAYAHSRGAKLPVRLSSMSDAETLEHYGSGAK